ncbi:expressed unknown protein [Seminavis robusta]|uniref:Uncharacterized protein n=1 Tax=Seminavis robusta TaxID=568900 RepID=A0A9N8DE20_9STRA|nr:expressed unknown protein [Seminavis robusta]|eukprot:Sro75_g041270.1 n/a (601) ;mRNA; r:72329-74214
MTTGQSNGYKRKGKSCDGDDDSEVKTLLPLHAGIDSERPEQGKSREPSALWNNAKLQIGLSLFCLLVLPCFIYGHIPGGFSPLGFYHAMINFWDSFLHVSIYLVASVTFLTACLYLYIANSSGPTTLKKDKKELDSSSLRGKVWHVIGTHNRFAVLVIALFVYLSSVTSIQTLVNPGWIWMPFLLINYQVVWPSELHDALKDICLHKQTGDLSKDPLCLSEKKWKLLSASALSSKNKEDVEAVMAGIEFAQKDTSGLIVNVLARDVADHIEQLQQNVQALSFFFPKLSVVIFENDSTDGSREAFKAWAAAPNKGYEVDLMSCPEAEDCKLKREHRYDGKKDEDFFTAPSIGLMHKFRQRMVDYIIDKPEYNNFSHMMQIDLDIGVSLSPLGVLHSIGKAKDSAAVASSCRQPWAGGLGTLVPPYDFNAFQPLRTKENERLFQIHEKFCGLMPPNDKWAFNCVGPSAVHFLQIIQLDRANDDLYPVASAYNGATLYPLQLIRKNHPKYDSGEYGHRCEHVGFNLSIDKQIYVNPKWDCHMSPTLPGGPKGERAMKSVKRFASLPRVSIPLFLQTFVPLVLCTFSVMTLSFHALRPLFEKPR